MKKIFLILGLLAAIGTTGWFVYKNISQKETVSTKYVCPMHPQIIRDKPGVCPICGMTLVPVSGGTQDTGHGTTDHGEGAFLLTPERRQTIGVTMAKVVKKSLQQEIRLPGRVAYDSDLYVTEKEYVEGLKLGAGDVLPAIEKKLQRLGISPEEIKTLKKTQKADESLFLPKEKGGRWVYASIYESDIPFVAPGQQATITLSSDKSIFLEGVVKGVTPTLDAMTRTGVARIWVAEPGQNLKPETYVDVTLKKDLGEQLAVPASAMINTGVQEVVLVDLGDGYLEPRVIKIGPKAGSDYPVVEGLEVGESVITSAQFLLDSESQIQAAIKKFGGHQH